MTTISGGDKLEARLKELSQNVTKAATLSVGFLEGATYPDGTSVALVAAIQEFGAPSKNIPPRPYFRGMIAQHSGEWPELVAGLLKVNDYDAEKTLRVAGDGIKGQLQNSISEFVGVPLAPATIKKKGSEKQLIQSGHLLNSVEAIVE